MIATAPPAPRPVLAALACLGLLVAARARASCPAACPAPAAWTQPFPFAGLTWERKSGCGGPGPNCWAPENAAPIAGEGVRLRLGRADGRWYAGEIRTTAPVGYGHYSVQVVGRPDLFDPNVVLGIFLYDDGAAENGEPCPAELDLESSRFGDPLAGNGHGVVYLPGQCGPSDLYDFDYALSGTFSTHQLGWGPGTVRQRWLHGHRCEPESPELLIAERTFSSPRVPAPGSMRLHINLWAFAGNPPGDQREVEIVIRDIVTTCPVVAVEPPPSREEWNLAVRPNPSRNGTDVWFGVPVDGQVLVTVMDVSGRRIATLVDEALPAGRHVARWGPTPRVPGVYFVRLALGHHVATRRLVVLE